jgi:hydroxymethylglutaryl-CoA reductase (NADPH)
MAIPSFLLKALYVKNSLQNIEGGFEFQLKNELGPARIIGAQPLKVDRKPLPLESCSFVHDGEEMAFTAVTPENSVLMRKGEAVTIRVMGEPLKSGRRSLDIGMTIKNMGNLSFNVGDQVR